MSKRKKKEKPSNKLDKTKTIVETLAGIMAIIQTLVNIVKLIKG